MKVINIQSHVDEYNLINPELLACKIIECIKTNEDIVLRTKEGKSCEANGLFSFLDNICDFYKFPKNKITIETNNWSEQHHEYNVIKAMFHYELSLFYQENKVVSYNGNKYYGLFIGRADYSRIRTMVLHKRLNGKIPSLSSFNHNFITDSANEDIYRTLVNTDTTDSEIKKLKQYSDIGNTIKPPIIFPDSFYGDHWENVYKEIAIELVCETTLHPNSFHMTEKTFRPIYYRRPFILIGADGIIKKMQGLGFKTFDELIMCHQLPVTTPDDAFRTLQMIYLKFTGAELLDKLRDQIEHNYSLLLNISNNHRKLSIQNDEYGYFNKK